MKFNIWVFLKHFKYISLNICLSLILTIIIFFLINSGIIKNIVGGPFTESFSDLKYHYIQWLECYRLELNDEICKFWPMKYGMDYGMIFLKTPFNPTLKFFYINYLPYITILLFVFTITFLLFIPLTAMQFTKDVNWSLFNFLIMGILLLSTGLMFELILEKIKKVSIE